MDHSEGHPIKPVYSLKTVVLVLLRLAVYTNGQEIDPCPDWFTLHGEMCYRHMKEKETWESAKKMCSDVGANLVEPRSIEENKVVQDLADDYVYPRSWLGGSQSSTTGKWKWDSDRRFVTWTHWGWGEPGGSLWSGRLGDVIAMKKDGTWYTTWSQLDLWVICQAEKKGGKDNTGGTDTIGEDDKTDGKDKTGEEDTTGGHNPESSAPRLAVPSILMSVCVFATAVYMM